MAVIPPKVLLEGYSIGIFPMADSDDDHKVKWYTAERRGIIPLDEFSVSSNAERLIRQERYTIRFNHAFRETMEHCANRETTWISDDIIESYVQLHRLGHAHSVEVYNDEDEMAGGLYGVSLAGAFFGESMFNYDRETSKIALWYCHKALVEGGFVLWDTQFYTEHLGQFGGIEISAKEYERRLVKAMNTRAEFKPPRL